MKVGDNIVIKAIESDLEYIPQWIRGTILNNPTGIIHKIHGGLCDVRTCHGLWLIDRKLLEVVNG